MVKSCNRTTRSLCSFWVRELSKGEVWLITGGTTTVARQLAKYLLDDMEKRAEVSCSSPCYISTGKLTLVCSHRSAASMTFSPSLADAQPTGTRSNPLQRV